MSITDPHAVWELCSDPSGRMKSSHRDRGQEIRCHKGHLIAWLLPTANGQLWARRSPWVEHDHTNGWEVGWAEVDGTQDARCSSCQGTWLLDPTRADATRRRLSPADLRPTRDVLDLDSTEDPFD